MIGPWSAKRPVRAALSEEIPGSTPLQKGRFVGRLPKDDVLSGSVISEGMTFSVLQMEVFHLTAVDPRSSPSISQCAWQARANQLWLLLAPTEVDGCEVRKFRINH